MVGREQFIKGDTTLMSMCMEEYVSICCLTGTVFLIYIGELPLLQGRRNNVVLWHIILLPGRDSIAECSLWHIILLPGRDSIADLWHWVFDA